MTELLPTVLYFTKQELKDMAFETHSNAESFIMQHSPDLFDKYMRLYVPVHEGWGDVLNGSDVYATNCLLAHDDKVLMRISDVVHLFLCYTDDTKDQSMVLTIEPANVAGYVEIGVDVIDVPKYNGTTPTHYAKTFEFVDRLGEASEAKFMEAWAHAPKIKHYSPAPSPTSIPS